MRDRFSDWSLYHKLVLAFVAALGVGIVIRAILVIDTAFEVTYQRDVNASAETVWSWVSGDTNRDKWQAELMDLVELTGPSTEPGATRLVFWKRGLRRWQAVERTRDIIPGRVLSLYQSSDQDTRWVSISLQVIDTCTTTVTIEEIIEPSEYLKRFWFFNQRPLHNQRMAASLDALERWTSREDTSCSG